jgi:predicted extracellular nuclease
LNPANEITCDRNSDGSLDGNRLFSRPPLVARFELKSIPQGLPAPFELIIVANHWKSKVEDTDQIAYTHPRRYEEAAFVSELVAQLAVQYPGVVILVLGDLNDYPSSGPLTTLKSGGLVDLSSQIDRSQRYTYIHKGISQMLDYVLVTPGMHIGGRVVPAHINADYPEVFEGVADSIYRSSDHDMLRADFVWLPESVYLPLVFSND